MIQKRLADILEWVSYLPGAKADAMGGEGRGYRCIVMVTAGNGVGAFRC